jgi:hypothetical protein
MDPAETPQGSCSVALNESRALKNYDYGITKLRQQEKSRSLSKKLKLCMQSR